jgi:hypothetical protein
MKEPSWLVRTIKYFSNETEELVGEFTLPEVDLAAIQILWNQQPTEPMVDMFSIDESQSQYFRQIANIQFDFSHYSYFLTAHTADWDATKREGGYIGLYPPPKNLPAFPDAKPVMPKTSTQ